MTKRRARRKTPIDELHEALFGFVPKKDGVAYERLSAVVFAGLGWVDVEHDRLERQPNKRAAHQLDVVCRRADDSVRRLIIECKDWDRTVGQGVIVHLVGVRDQVKADAVAVVTRKGFKKGALGVAADAGVTLVRLRPYEAERDDGTWIQNVNVTMRMGFPVFVDVEFVTASASDAQALQGVRTPDWMSVCDMQGELAETFQELWQTGSMEDQADGTRRGSLDLPDRRMVQSHDGTWIPIQGIRWTQKIIETEETINVAAKGKPLLVLQQLDEKGNAAFGKVIADERLSVWEIDASGNVSSRSAIQIL